MQRRTWIGVTLAAALIGCGSDSYELRGDSAPGDDVACLAIEGGGGGAGGEAKAGPSPQPGQLTAGEWRDLDNWDLWEKQSELHDKAEAWGLSPRRRIPVRVACDGAPVVDARVALLDAREQFHWEARSDNRGRAELFVGLTGKTRGLRLEGASVLVEAGSVRKLVALDPQSTAPLVVELESAPRPERALDVMFMVDVTGSMGDELRYLQSELKDVLQSAQARLREQVRLRAAVGVYRDHGDNYVVRSHPFSTDVEKVCGQLGGESAGGGGDYPEAVDEALEAAVTKNRWSASARARLLFLVLDAPPHQEPARIQRLRQTLRAAARDGIRVIPVVASGSDRSNEALLRALAIGSGGTYTFLTDHSGIGGAHLEPTIGDYSVEMLNDLLVRLIVEAVQEAPAALPAATETRRGAF